MITATTKIAQTTLLCAGLLVTSSIWSCPDEASAQNAPKLSAVQAQVQPTSDLYNRLHNPELNRPDNLGDYAEDYRAAYPN